MKIHQKLTVNESGESTSGVGTVVARGRQWDEYHGLWRSNTFKLLSEYDKRSWVELTKKKKLRDDTSALSNGDFSPLRSQLEFFYSNGPKN